MKNDYVFAVLIAFVVEALGCTSEAPPNTRPMESLSDPFSAGATFNTIDPSRTFAIIEPPNTPASLPDIDRSKPLFALPYEFQDDVQIVGFDHSGNLRELSRVPVGNGPRDVAVLDVNHDGMLDLVTADTGGSTLTLLVNDINGNFNALSTIPMNMAPLHLAVADMDGDGPDELIVSMGFDAQAGISVWTTKSGSLVPWGEFLPFPGATRMAIGNLDADAKPDLVIVHSDGLSLLHNEGATFSLVTLLAPCDIPWTALIANFNGNDLGDVVVACNGEAVLLLDPLAGLDNSRSLGPTGQLYDLVAADFDGHGTLDIAAADVTKHQMPLWLSPMAELNVSAFHHVVHRGPVALRAGDFDHDGDTDVGVLAYEQRTLEVFENQMKK